MATLSTHTLNSVDGTHAGGVRLTLTQLMADGGRKLILDSATDEGGRFAETLALSVADTACRYEMVLQTGEYFTRQAVPVTGTQIMREVVVRFEMPDVDGKYHIPLMLAPNSYSVWWSA